MLAVAASALVLLVSSGAAASGGHAPESAANNTAGTSATLTVTVSGEGAGWVGSSPAGISCVGRDAGICSAQFPVGTALLLHAETFSSSTFGGYSANCGPVLPLRASGPDDCTTFLGDDVNVSVEATFSREPPPCTAPSLKGRTLATAKALLWQRHCSVGNVTRAHSLKVQKGRIISQNPSAGWQREPWAKVNLVVGKGRR